MLHCVITSPEGLVFEGDARSVVVPAIDGELGILPRHAPLVGMLGSGEVRVEGPEAAGKKSHFFLNGGFLQVLKDQVTVLATQAESLVSIDRAEAEAELNELLRHPPGRGSTLVERDAYLEKLHAARMKVKLAG